MEKIARSFNERGIPKKTCGGLWRSGDIGRILENEKHVGDALLQKKIKKDFKLIPNDGTVPQYYVENNHEPNVTRELFEAVQAIRTARRANVKTSPTRLSPFAGKITCAECGKGYKHRKNNRNSPYEKWIWSCSTYVHMGRKYCGGHNIREKDFIQLFLSAYNEAAGFQPHAIKDLGEAIKDLLAQERELIALKAKGYMKREDYEIQHAELLRQIQETEAEFAKGTQSVEIHLRADEYHDRFAASLEGAAVDGFEITFTFKNGAKIKRIFNNDTNRKETWAKKLGGIA